MMQNRRDFLKNSGWLAGALTAGQLFSRSAYAQAYPTVKNFGIQLYTLRDILPGNAKEIFKKLASFGFTELESYEGPEGIYWGMSATECGDYIKSLGMQLVATHCDIQMNFEQKVNEAASIGMKYVICPWLGPQKSISAYQRFASDFNEKGEICKKHGIRFAYHNHDYSFKPVENRLPQEVLLKETDPELVDFEMDIFWVQAGGGEPLEWFRKYPGRFKLSHIKDRSKVPAPSGAFESTDLGTGTIDYAKLLPIAKELGLEYFFMEQEAYPYGTPLAAAKVGADYLRKLNF